MDRMVTTFNRIVGIACIACLSMALHFGANAQSQPSSSPSQEKVTNSNLSDPQSNTALDNLALNSEIAAPKIKPKNPAPNFKVTARNSKTDARAFALPNEDLGEEMTFHATAYALKGRTRIGTSVRRGVVAADPRVLPLGSVVQIKSGKYTGVYKVEDTGRVIKGNIIDVWVPDNREARQFGRRKIQLSVLKMGPSKTRKIKK
ncbi:MAG: 3D domain-containing protein [Blastocatellia bacterium]